MTVSRLYRGDDLGMSVGNQLKLIKCYHDENIQIQTLMGLETILSAHSKGMWDIQKRLKELILAVQEITNLINEGMKK